MELPPVGFGTMGIDDPDAVTDALAAGYRHLDTAQIYDNETAVGAGLAAADIPRETVTVATKLWTDGLAGDTVRESTRTSLDHDGVVAIPRATSPAHRRANLAAADLSLTSAERRQIDEIDREEELFPE